MSALAATTSRTSRRHADFVEIHGPAASGKVKRFTDLPVDRYITITEKP